MPLTQRDAVPEVASKDADVGQCWLLLLLRAIMIITDGRPIVVSINCPTTSTHTHIHNRLMREATTMSRRSEGINEFKFIVSHSGAHTWLAPQTAPGNRTGAPRRRAIQTKEGSTNNNNCHHLVSRTLVVVVVDVGCNSTH